MPGKTHVEPISPDEVRRASGNLLRAEALEAVNALIIEGWNGWSSTVCGDKLRAARGGRDLKQYWVEAMETTYEGSGWSVAYPSDWSYFLFTPK